jgi:hypothetical protein
MSERKLARALSQLVGNPAFRENAQYISKHLRMEDGAATAADIIEQETTAFSAALTDARLKRRNWMTRNFVEE